MRDAASCISLKSENRQSFWVGLFMNCSVYLSLGMLFCSSTRALAALEYELIPDIRYAGVEEQNLELDLYLPRNNSRAPLIVWVHGGAWRSGSRKHMPLEKLVE